MKNLYIIFFLFFIKTGISQQLIMFSDTRTETYLVKEEAGGKNSHLNQIIKTLAIGNNKPSYSTKFYFGYKLKSRIVKKNNTLEFIAEIEDIGFSGDIKYKGFEMREFLFPNNVDFQLNWLLRNGNLIKSFQFTNVQINSENLVLADFYEPDTLNNNSYKFELVNKNFLYNNLNWKLFKNKTDLIDEYYNADNQFKMAFFELESIKPNQIEKLFEFKNIVDKNEILISTLNKKDFFNQLNLNHFDPIFFDEKLTNLINLNNKVKNEVYYSIQNLFEIYYKRGLDYLSQGKIEFALQDFNKSINNNLFFTPSHYQIAKINYNKKNYDLATEGVQNILNKMNPDPLTYNLTIELAKAIYSSIISEAKIYNQQQNYEQALNLLNQAKLICQTTTGLLCTEELEIETKNSINGKYNKYLVEIEKNIKTKNYNNAESNIQTARFFYQSNSNILDVSMLNFKISELYNSYIIETKNELSKNNCNNAQKYFNKSNQICSTNNSIECSSESTILLKNVNICIYNAMLYEANILFSKLNLDEAEKQINNADKYRISKNIEINNQQLDLLKLIYITRFDNHISRAKLSFNENKYNQSIIDLENAKVISEKYDMVYSQENQNLLITSVNNRILQLVEYGNSEVAKNNLKNSRDAYSDAKNLHSKYSIDEPKINESLNTLKGKIFSQECKNAQTEYNKQFDIVNSYINEKSFIDAERAIDKAFQIVEKNNNCDLDIELANKKRSEIIPAFTYQKLYKNIEQLLKQGSYDELYIKYQELEMYYYEFNVEKYEIKHLKLQEFILICNSEFVKNSIIYYSKQNDLNYAFSFLKELKKRNYNPKWCINEQKLLGEKMAKADKNKTTAINYKENLLNYTENDKWFKEFKKSYIFCWKK